MRISQRSTTGATRGLALAAVCVPLLAGCAPPPPRELPPIEKESPRTEILRIGHTWRALAADKGFRSEPSPIGVFQAQTRSIITFPKNGAEAVEQVYVRESFSMRDGKRYNCLAEGSRTDTLRFARRPSTGNAAVELSQPELQLVRQCHPAGFPNGTLTLPARTARFGLRGDQLIAYEPVIDTRIYIPIQ